MPIRQLDQMLEHIESLEYIVEEMAQVGVDAHIETHLAEFKEDVLRDLGLLLMAQHRAAKEIKSP